jgi:hypothetical protein
MCGIVGMVSKWSSGFNYSHAQAFEELLYADAVRGMDSTGVFGITKKKQADVLKQAVDPGLFMRSKSWQNWREDISKKMLIAVGHNRKATVGEIVSKTAHPFVEGKTVLVHNGYIQNHKELDATVEVDSQAAARLLDKTENPIHAIQKLYGAFSMVWFNHTKRELYLVRNSERPMYLCHNTDGMFFASEEDMLSWILKRNKITGCGPIVELPIYTLVTVKVDPFTIKEEKFEAHVVAPSIHYREYPRRVVEPGEDDHPLPELEMAKREALKEAGKDDNVIAQHNEKVKVFFNNYRQGSTALFWPTNYFPEGDDKYDKKRIRVEGDLWVPGKPGYKATCSIPAENDPELYIDVEYPLAVDIQMFSRRGDVHRAIVGNMRRLPEVLEDHIGTKIPYMEWQMICENLFCAECSKPVASWQVDGCSVSRVFNGSYRVICPKCISIPNEKVKAVLAKEKKNGTNGK